MMKFSYDANGRQISASNLDDTNPETSVYDGLGQRVQTTSSIGTRQVVYDAFGRDIAEYVIGGAQTTSGLTYFMQDEKGSTRVGMSGTGVTARHDFLPFGEEIGANTGLRATSQGYGGADTNRQKFGGMERDDANGLDHTMWRKYENYGGRWTSPDPYKASIKIGNPQSLNRYAYVGNDPVNSIDSSGLDMGDYEGISRPWVDPDEPPRDDQPLGLGISYKSLIPFLEARYVSGLNATITLYRINKAIEEQARSGKPSELQKAIDKAQEALQKASCRDLFGSKVDASALLADLAAGNAGLGSISPGDLGGPRNGSVTAANTTGILGSRSITGLDGTTVRQSTFTGANIVINSNTNAPFQNGFRDYLGVGADDPVYRAVTIIHELGHAVAIIYGASASKILDDQDNPAQSRANSKLVDRNMQFTGECYNG